MVEIKFASNFDEIQSITERLLTKYDIENNINCNLKKFAFLAKENSEYVEYIFGKRFVNWTFNYFKNRNL